MTITGARGSLRWGYHEAATLVNWTVSRSDDGDWSFSGMVQDGNTFRLSQRPIVFVVPRAKGTAWNWAVQTLQIEGAFARGTLGPRDSANGVFR